MGRRGREYARTELSWDGIAKGLEDHLVGLLSSGTGREFGESFSQPT
jgi:hypothetical protein